MEQIDVRPMLKGDYAGVRAVDELTQIQYRGLDWSHLSDEEKDADLVSRASEFDLNLGTGYCFVATMRENVVAFVLAYETLPFRGTLFVRHIAVNPDDQGKGIGMKLYEALAKKAKERGIKRITTTINNDNPRSMAFQKQAGFEVKDIKEAVLRLE